MALTFVNKYYIDQIFEETLQRRRCNAKRYMTNPTILNNVLWSATAETQIRLHFQGSYSPLTEKNFKLVRIPKQHQLLGEVEGDSTIEILNGLANTYYSVLEGQDGKLQFNGMRYGVPTNATKAGIGEDDFILNCCCQRQVAGQVQARRGCGRPPAGKEKR